MLQELMLNDLLGPAGGEHEEVDGRERLSERYLVGSLAPRGARLEPANDDDLSALSGEEDDGEGGSDPENAGPSNLLPSSLGLSFMVDDTVTELVVTARWGRYRREKSESALDPRTGEPLTVWKREPMGGSPVRIPLRDFPAQQESDAGTPLEVPDPRQPEVVLSGRMRHRDGHWFVTLFIRNEQDEPQRNKDERWLFQVELEVEGDDGTPIFVHRPIREFEAHDEEQAESAMLFRREREFAMGHGVAVTVDQDEGDPGRARRIRTTSVPEYEVPRTDAPSLDSLGLVTDMKALSEISDGAFGAALTPLIEAYRGWIGERREEVRTDRTLEEHTAVAESTLVACEGALSRIEAGITLLDEGETTAAAFRFANRAMHLQRIHTIYANTRREADDPATVTLEEIDEPKNRSWRPFQLAFILANLPSLSQLDHPDRSTDPSAAADLLWFPTGGGKTEAYLGLTAFTLAVRRLQGEVNGLDGTAGVAVIMRYTLRLLTLQQFQRATALMCACEIIRRENPETWGEEPFRIGLWVGKSMTPNWTSEADKAIASKRNDGFARGTGNPHQLTFCPWCGETIQRRSHIDVETVDKGVGRTFIYCGDKRGQCPFSRRQAPRAGLPVLVVDEEIYKHPPSLLIATVDKFAQMPWRGAVQNLFGRVERRCERHGYHAADIDDANSHPAKGSLPAAKTVTASPLRPPDLIIQDELHLISGPLGTMVGLYETAVDSLATWNTGDRDIRPKVIASTATIRRASRQVHDFFLRKVNVFPPNGLDAGDNFFSLQRKVSEEAPGRLYMGICARGRRMKATLIRVYTAQLAAAQTLFDEYGSQADPYMTLVGYFGALRELGGMRRLIDDDVAQRLRSMNQRGLANRKRPNVQELTSRLGSDQVPEVLDRLSVPNDPNTRDRLRYPIDVLLATNMISVGVDVPRLGVMVVAGQPKNTAEYIQATSRVGREHPGLVVTVYHWTRPRDLSHYEGFNHYHATLYRQVEPLSVTPFAPRAIDRGLSGVLVSMVRLTNGTLAENTGASRVEFEQEVLDRVVRAIEKRAGGVTGDHQVGQYVETGLNERIDTWQTYARDAIRNTTELAYETKRGGRTVPLLRRAEEEPVWDIFTTLSSLRDVEPPIGLILQENMEMDDPDTFESDVLMHTMGSEGDTSTEEQST